MSADLRSASVLFTALPGQDVTAARDLERQCATLFLSAPETKCCGLGALRCQCAASVLPSATKLRTWAVRCSPRRRSAVALRQAVSKILGIKHTPALVFCSATSVASDSAAIEDAFRVRAPSHPRLPRSDLSAGGSQTWHRRAESARADPSAPVLPASAAAQAIAQERQGNHDAYSEFLAQARAKSEEGAGPHRCVRACSACNGTDRLTPLSGVGGSARPLRQREAPANETSCEQERVIPLAPRRIW